MTQSGGDQTVYPYDQDLRTDKNKKTKKSDGENLFLAYDPNDMNDYIIGYMNNQEIFSNRNVELFDNMKDLSDFMDLNGIDITLNYPTRTDFEEAYPNIDEKYVDELYNSDGSKKTK